MSRKTRKSRAAEWSALVGFYLQPCYIAAVCEHGADYVDCRKCAAADILDG
jgi:hypothetical protein